MENLFKKNPLQDLPSSLNAVISTNESTQFRTGHVIYNPAYTYKFQQKTTHKATSITRREACGHSQKGDRDSSSIFCHIARQINLWLLLRQI